MITHPGRNGALQTDPSCLLTRPSSAHLFQNITVTHSPLLFAQEPYSIGIAQCHAARIRGRDVPKVFERSRIKWNVGLFLETAASTRTRGIRSSPAKIFASDSWSGRDRSSAQMLPSLSQRYARIFR